MALELVGNICQWISHLCIILSESTIASFLAIGTLFKISLLCSTLPSDVLDTQRINDISLQLSLHLSIWLGRDLLYVIFQLLFLHATLLPHSLSPWKSLSQLHPMQSCLLQPWPLATMELIAQYSTTTSPTMIEWIGLNSAMPKVKCNILYNVWPCIALL